MNLMLVLQQILKFESSLSVHVNAVALGVAQYLKNTILLAYVYHFATTCGAYTFYWPMCTPLQPHVEPTHFISLCVPL